jgi:hypothetical protein
VHRLFNDQTHHFNVTPRELTKASVDGIVDWWEPEIGELEAQTQQLYRAGDITQARFNKMQGALSRLERIAAQLKGLSARFDKYPYPRKIILDI